MKRVFFYIALCILVLLLWIGSSFAKFGTSSVQDSGVPEVSYIYQPVDSIVTPSFFSNTMNADLGGCTNPSQLIEHLRIQRSRSNNIIFSIKDFVHLLINRLYGLAASKLQYWDSFSLHSCQPVCKYYIFTLRRIII